MLPWVKLGSVTTEDGVELKLMRRGSEFSIMLGTNELMNSRLSGSEEALATLATAEIAERPEARVLIGGLGMGFTLRVALRTLAADARVTVAELMPAVVEWARGPMAEVLAGSLDDPRVIVREEDVGVVIRAAARTWDAIMLDVDNGPEGLTRQGNDTLYSTAGLTATLQALKPGGVFTMWSSAPDPAFTRRLKKVGFTVAEVPTRGGKKRGARHMIWVAVK